MTTPKGFTPYTNASAMDGPNQINTAELFLENLIGESVTAASALPASGNWVGRTATATDTGNLYMCTALPGTWSVVREDTGWITPPLLNGWTVFEGRTVKYRKKNGVVYLKGCVSGGTTGAIFNLPAGFRPASSQPADEQFFFVATGSTVNVTVRIVVQPSGDVLAQSGSAPHLEPVQFVQDA